jgi:hypothetical protein
MFEMTGLLVGSASMTDLLGYLDPGSGSMVLQVLVASLFSGLFFIRSTYSFVKSKLSHLQGVR